MGVCLFRMWKTLFGEYLTWRQRFFTARNWKTLKSQWEGVERQIKRSETEVK